MIVELKRNESSRAAGSASVQKLEQKKETVVIAIDSSSKTRLAEQQAIERILNRADRLNW